MKTIRSRRRCFSMETLWATGLVLTWYPLVSEFFPIVVGIPYFPRERGQ